MEVEDIILLSWDEVNIQFQAEVKNFFPKCFVGESTEEMKDFQMRIHSNQFQFIQHYLEIHDYQDEAMVIQLPLVNGKLQQHLDPQSYQIFKDLNKPEDIEKVMQIAQDANFLGFFQLYLCAMCVIGCILYIEDPENPSLLKDYKQKFGITEDPTEQDFQEIEKQYQHVFQTIHEHYHEVISDEQSKITIELKKQLEKQAGGVK